MDIVLSVYCRYPVLVAVRVNRSASGCTILYTPLLSLIWLWPSVVFTMTPDRGSCVALSVMVPTIVPTIGPIPAALETVR